jgi:hypothetical protein
MQVMRGSYCGASFQAGRASTAHEAVQISVIATLRFGFPIWIWQSGLFGDYQRARTSKLFGLEFVHGIAGWSILHSCLDYKI